MLLLDALPPSLGAAVLLLLASPPRDRFLEARRSFFRWIASAESSGGFAASSGTISQSELELIGMGGLGPQVRVVLALLLLSLSPTIVQRSRERHNMTST